MQIDLQLHSTYSDGYLTPTKLADYISSKGIRIASLTDHNTVGGLDEFEIACKRHGIKSIPGLELYVRHNKKMFNLLWYNYRASDPDLHKMLRDSQIRRRSNARTILEKLNQSGFKISIDKILDKYNHYIPLNHMIDDILQPVYNKTKVKKELGDKYREEDIIKKYFYNKEIGRFYESYININHILKLKKKIGGQLILNHPGKYNQLDRGFLIILKNLGVDGIEVLSPHHSIGAVLFAQQIAKDLGLITTGGTDFHKFEGGKIPVQSSLDYFKIYSSNLRGVNKIIG